MRDGDRNDHTAEGTPSGTLGTPGGSAAVKTVSQESLLWPILNPNGANAGLQHPQASERQLSLSSPPALASNLEASPKSHVLRQEINTRKLCLALPLLMKLRREEL